MKKNILLAKTIVISGMAAALNYLITFLLTPYITERIGIEAYGFVSIAKTAVSYAQIFTISLTTFVVRYIFMEYHEQNMEEANAYYSSSITGCAAMSGGIFLCCLPVICKLEYFLNIPSELTASVKLLFGIVFFNFVIQTMVTPFQSYAYIRNRLDLAGIVQMLSYLADAVGLLCLFGVFPPTVWFVGAGSMMASFVSLLGSMYLRKKMVPELHFHRALVSWKKVKTMVSHGVWNSINSLGTVLNSGLDLLISNLMLSSLATGQISIAKTIEMMFVAVQQLVTQPFQPTLLKAYAGGDGEEFFRELSKAMKLTGLLSNIFLGGFIALGQLYYRLWLPGQDDQMLYRLTVLTILTSLLSGVMRPVYYVYTVTVKNRIPCLVTVAGGFFNVAGMYLLLRFTNLGAYAVVLTTVVVMFSINLIFNPLYASHCIHIRPFRMYCVILRHIVSAVLMTVVFCLLERWIQPSGWIGLAASAALMAVLGAGIHVLVCMTPKKGKTNR